MNPAALLVLAQHAFEEDRFFESYRLFRKAGEAYDMEALALDAEAERLEQQGDSQGAQAKRKEASPRWILAAVAYTKGGEAAEQAETWRWAPGCWRRAGDAYLEAGGAPSETYRRAKERWLEAYNDAASRRAEDAASTGNFRAAAAEGAEWAATALWRSGEHHAWRRFVWAAYNWCESAEIETKHGRSAEIHWRRAAHCARLACLTHIEENGSLVRTTEEWVIWPVDKSGHELLPEDVLRHAFPGAANLKDMGPRWLMDRYLEIRDALRARGNAEEANKADAKYIEAKARAAKERGWRGWGEGLHCLGMCYARSIKILLLSGLAAVFAVFPALLWVFRALGWGDVVWSNSARTSASPLELVYFSVTTAFTVGYGDLVPVYGAAVLVIAEVLSMAAWVYLMGSALVRKYAT
jgi:hypothetical protein